MKSKHATHGAVALVALAGLTGCASQTGPAGSASGSPSTSAVATSGRPADTGPASAGASPEPAPPAPTAADPTAAEAEREAVITIRDFRYDVPGSVAPGATVTVVNEDTAPHTVTDAESGIFDAEARGGGTVTFTAPEQPGEYGITCTYHPQMSGTLVVR